MKVIINNVTFEMSDVEITGKVVGVGEIDYMRMARSGEEEGSLCMFYNGSAVDCFVSDEGGGREFGVEFEEISIVIGKTHV